MQAMSGGCSQWVLDTACEADEWCISHCSSTLSPSVQSLTKVLLTESTCRDDRSLQAVSLVLTGSAPVAPGVMPRGF